MVVRRGAAVLLVTEKGFRRIHSHERLAEARGRAHLTFLQVRFICVRW